MRADFEVTEEHSVRVPLAHGSTVVVVVVIVIVVVVVVSVCERYRQTGDKIHTCVPAEHIGHVVRHRRNNAVSYW